MNPVSAFSPRISRSLLCLRRGSLGLLGAGLLASLPLLLLGAPVGDPKGTGPANAAPAEPPEVEVRFRDNSLVKLNLQTESIIVATRYGRLTIPAAEIGKIQFATRVPETLTRRIEVAIKGLGSKEFKERERSADELTRIGMPALPALQAASESDDAEVKHAAEELLGTIKEGVPEELLAIRDQDVVHTKDSKITGTIETNVFRGVTVPFGEVQVKLADMRVLRSPRFADPEPEVRAGAMFLPPGAGVNGLAGQIGRKVTLTLTGNVNGAVWGSNLYTMDSDPGTAAVHAGALKPGQTAAVTVQIVPTPQVFTGSLQNGITSAPWAGGQASAFQFVKRR